jgi:hypothetical protein
MDEQIPLTEKFPALTAGRITPEIGIWYLSAKCDECGSNNPLMPDSSNGRNERPFTDGGGEFEQACGACGSRVVATGDKVFPHRWTQSDQDKLRY